ncbi:hypothetical protein T4D_11021 [Trichinella pseudospiralis]|uniref:Uncharacterized protein n=1 Tax=Trichinella pseudospiralis TaxID=6337 RepID=A0A0V1G4K3_TRIPS|nr:hypothetical protein T4D_11021 [Trichinella pseudospiralis]
MEELYCLKHQRCDVKFEILVSFRFLLLKIARCSQSQERQAHGRVAQLHQSSTHYPLCQCRTVC